MAGSRLPRSALEQQGTDRHQVGDHSSQSAQREQRVFLGWNQLPMTWHRSEEDPVEAEHALEPEPRQKGPE